MSPATETLDRARRGAPAALQRRRRHTLLLQHDGLWDAGHPAAPNAPSQWHAGFEAWCDAMQDASCELLLSGSMVHDLVCDPGLPLASDAQLLDHARAVFAHYHGEAAAGWQLACWSSGSQCGVSALHGANVAELRAIAQRHRVQIRVMLPWWARVLALAMRRLPALRTTPVAWLVIAEAGYAHALRLERGECAAVRAQWLDGPTPLALGQFAAQLVAAQRADAPVVLAMGYGMSSGSAAGVELLGGLDEVAPPRAWLVEHATRP